MLTKGVVKYKPMGDSKMIKKCIFLAILILVSTFVYAAPQVSDVSITNTAPILTGDNIVCQFKLNSTLGESVWANVTWYKNSVAQTTVQKGPVTSIQTLNDVLMNTQTTKGDSWFCSVKGYNSSEETAVISSNAVTIVNTNVSLSDIPAQTYIRNSGTKSVSLSSYAIDADSDPIVFTASSADASKVACGISGQSLTIVSVGTFTGVGYCNVTAYDGTYLTAPKTVAITVRDQQTLLSLPSYVYLGSSSNQDRNESVSGSFVISNNGVSGDKSITSIEVSTNAASTYKVNFSLDNSIFQPVVSGFSLNPGESKTIYYTGFVPANIGSGNNDIGDITVKSSETTQTISNFFINGENMLAFYDINVDVDGNTDSSISVSGDDISKDAHPGSVVKLDIKLQNLFSYESKTNMESVQITAEIPDMSSNTETDFTQETSNFNIKYNSKSDYKTLTFNIPDDVDSGDYDIVITAEGSDSEYGADYKVSTTLTLTVQREEHLIKITKASLGNSEVSCKDYATLNVVIQDLGNNDEDETVLTVKNADLGLFYDSGNIQLSENKDDDNNDFSKLFTIDLSGKNLKSGIYPIEINTYYSEDILSDTKTVSLNVVCETEKATETVTKNDTVELINEANNAENQGGAVAQDVSSSDTVETGGMFGSGSGYITLLVIANIIVVVVALFLVFNFLMKPKN